MRLGAAAMLMLAACQPSARVEVAQPEDFDERYPFVIVTRKQDRDPTVEPSRAMVEAKIEQAVQKVHNRERRASCRRVHFYRNGHRHWRCRR